MQPVNTHFQITQTKFEREVAKWDESGNDIIVLAKHMSNIMMNMTDFTRGRGPLKTTMDVIGAAQEISIAGEKVSVRSVTVFHNYLNMAVLRLGVIVAVLQSCANVKEFKKCLKRFFF